MAVPGEQLLVAAEDLMEHLDKKGQSALVKDQALLELLGANIMPATSRRPRPKRESGKS